MKIYIQTIFAMLFICLGQKSFGQVTGRVTSESGRPVAAANITILNSRDSSRVKVGLSDEKGVFHIENPGPGTYLISISSIGYQPFTSALFEFTTGIKDVGTFVIKTESRELGEVNIRVSRPLIQQQAYGTTLNIENNLLSKGSSALEVLERSAGVVVDRRNNQIALNGKSGVIVMLDGKPIRISMDQVVTLLNSMSANDIQKIELLTTPPARYDADGNAGMINIVLKRNTASGTNGNLSLTGGVGWAEKATVSTNLTHNSGHSTLYGTYTYTRDRSYADWLAIASAYEPLLGGQTESEFLSTIKSLHNNHNATIGFESRPDSKTTFGTSITHTNSVVDIQTTNKATYMVLPDSLLHLNAGITGANNWKNSAANIYLDRHMGKGKKMNLSVDYLKYENMRPTSVQSSFVNKDGMPVSSNDTLFSPRQKGFAKTIINVGVAKIDYSDQVNDKLKLEAGFKGTLTKTSSFSGIESLVAGDWVTGNDAESDISMNEFIAGAYFSSSFRLGSVSNLVLGLRYEYSNTNMHDRISNQLITNRKIAKIFPNIQFTKKIGMYSELQLSFSKRISRPSYNDLASFVTYADPTSVETGNPLLLPAISNVLKLGYNYQGYSISALLSRDTNPIARNQTTTNTLSNMLVLSPQNLSYQNNLTLQTNLPWKVTDWWNMNYSFVGGRRKFRETFTQQSAEKTYFGYSTTFGQSFKLPQTLSLEISGWYNSSAYDGTKKVNGFGAVNMGIKKELSHHRGTLQLAITDLLKSVSITSYYGKITQEALNLKSRVTYNTESGKFQMIKLTYSKSFGSGYTKQQSVGGTKEERDRIRN